MTAQPRKPAKATQTVWVERWCPPKPLVTLTPIDKVLNRHTFLVTPESRLVVAVITRAIGDCLSLGRSVRREARRFLLGDDLGLWCDLVGLHPDFVRFVARKAGYLADVQNLSAENQAAIDDYLSSNNLDAYLNGTTTSTVTVETTG